MASLSDIQICNLALDHLGANSEIESFTETSTPAKTCKRWYDVCRRQVLEAFNWNFARRRTTLALHSDDPPDTWLFRYQYPSDCLKARLIQNPFDAAGIPCWPVNLQLGEMTDAIPFEIATNDAGDQRTILTDMEQAILVYTMDQKKPEMFSMWFVETLSHLMAARMAMKITQKKALRDGEYQAYINSLASAPGQEAQEGVEPAPRDALSIRARA